MKHKIKPCRYPPQPRRTWLSHKAEANKPLIIGIVAIIAVVGLGLMLFFSKQFVGKAVSIGEAGLDQAGIFLVDNTATVGDKITVPVKVNIGGKNSTVFFFSLEYDSNLLEVNCDSVAGEIKKLFTVDGEDFTVMGEPSCVENKVLFGYTALTDGNKVITGETVIADIEFTAKAAGTAEFKFNSFKVYDLETSEEILLEVKGALVVIGTVVSDAEPLCGNGRIDAGETCDNGNFSYGCDDFNLKGTPTCNNCIADYTACEFNKVGDSCMILAGLEEQGITSNCASGLSCENGVCAVVPTLEICGNGIIDTGEECDAKDVASCTSDCKATASYKYGDLNLDGEVNVADLNCHTLINLFNNEPFPVCVKVSSKLLDFNCDGTINVADKNGMIDRVTKSAFPVGIDANANLIPDCVEGFTPEAEVVGAILIELFPKLTTGGISTSSVSAAAKNENYNVKVTLRPDKELPANHLVIIALDYGGIQKTLFWDAKPILNKGSAEVISFDHQMLDAPNLKVKVLVWEAWPSESGWSDLLPKEEKSYEIE